MSGEKMIKPLNAKILVLEATVRKLCGAAIESAMFGDKLSTLDALYDVADKLSTLDALYDVADNDMYIHKKKLKKAK